MWNTTLQTVELWEHEACLLDEDEADALEDTLQQVWNNRRLSITYQDSDEDAETNQRLFSFRRLRTGGVEVTPRGFIGLVRVGLIQYVVLPKIYRQISADEIGRLLAHQFEYAEALKMPDSPETASSLDTIVELFSEVQISSFARITSHILLRRTHIDYQEVGENIQTIRGRISFKEHLRQNLSRGRYDRVFCRFELYQEDNLFLRIVKRVTRLVLARTKNSGTRRNLSEIIAFLDPVADVPCTYRDALRVKLNVFQRDLRPVLDYCKMFLSFRMAQGSAGDYGIDQVFIDTAELFERFLGGFLKKHLAGWDVRTKQRSYLASDSAGDLFGYENDILLVPPGGNNPIVVDAKYKSVDLSERSKHYGITHGDLYQLISYAVARNSTDVRLIYPGTEDGVSDVTFDVNSSMIDESIAVRALKFPMTTTNEARLQAFLEKEFSHQECLVSPEAETAQPPRASA
ncbi:MAG: hypothetical protein H7A22_06125 [Spirochaetales bacterium]|nr:hypothetical protein [Spirochaetales bacterium]